MGILYPLQVYCNKLIRAHQASKKPDWALNEKTKRAVRYANAYIKNAELVAFLNRRK